ncbi:MAG TPA: DNA cytosine methyltransferase [Phycisphaerae bacterium]|nr:DNA cytosine methyltransferase [Phycisphaerae bacterium]
MAHGQIPIIDLFAGPGGLGEGFAECAVGGSRPFRIALSVEKDEHAHETLRLRSFYRQYRYENRKIPAAYYQALRGDLSIENLAKRCPDAWDRAVHEALCATLGDPDDDRRIEETIRDRLKASGDTPRIVIGGPPCQAYSLVGRARNKGNADYVPEADHRHHLYVEYLRIIAQTWPDVFVMENVKGVLSSRLNGQLIFPRILKDLEDPNLAITGKPAGRSNKRYRLVSLTRPSHTRNQTDPKDFIVRCEDYGIPQCRHRVIIIGLREDLDAEFKPPHHHGRTVTVGEVIGGLPKLKSRLSRRSRATLSLSEAIESSFTSRLEREIRDSASFSVVQRCRKICSQKPRKSQTGEGRDDVAPTIEDKTLEAWLTDDRLGTFIPNHEARSHMASDLMRYIYAASYAESLGESPTLSKFPRSLLPNHENAKSATSIPPIFNDRFRVQLWNQAATTVTAHIAKDGHYYIHPDPEQFRSLSVREAARLQTFPDNYYFCGPRTSQYTQVGNAVPPLMARQIAESVYGFLREAGRI